jgi:hypothetical protein
MRFAAIGIDHRHIFGMAGHLIAEGAEFVCWWTEGTPETLDGFGNAFPRCRREADVQAVLEADVELILISCIPRDRAALGDPSDGGGQGRDGRQARLHNAGEQLDAIKDCVARTGRIWSIDFSERFEVPSVTMAADLVAEGAIGKVVQTLGHRARTD